MDRINAYDVNVSGLEEVQIASIMSLVTPVALPHHSQLLQKLLQEMKSEYSFSMKKSSLEYLEIPEEEQATGTEKLKVIVLDGGNGLVANAKFDFKKRRESLVGNPLEGSQTMFFVANASILKVIQVVFEKTEEISDLKLVDFDTKELELPTDLESFCQYQKDCCFKGRYKLNE